MKTKFTFWRKALAMLTLVAAAVSCSQDSEVESVAPSDKGHLITFDVVDDATTRGAINSTVTEFYVYAVDSKNETVLDNVKYTLVNGKWKAAEDCYSTDPELDFYFYTPSSASVTFNGAELIYNMPTDVVAQPDLLVGSTLDANPAEAVKLKFNRSFALIKFKVSGDCKYALESVKMSNIADKGTVALSNSVYWYNLGAVSSTEYSAGIIEGITAGGEGTNITSETGYLMVVPQTASPKITVTNTNKTEMSFELSNVNWEAGNIYPYTIGIDGIEPEVTVKPEDDYTEKDPSNCYIVNPKANEERIYHFPVQVRVNEYWGDYANVANNMIYDCNGLTIEQLWSDSAVANSLDVSLIMDKKNRVAMQVIVSAGNDNVGNAVYAVKKNGVILWSWHLWVTDYAPTTDYLNRYVGQKNTSSIAGAQLYQFGRKDPLNKNNGTAAGGSFTKGVQNPTTIYNKSNTSYYSGSWASDFWNSTHYNWGDAKASVGSKSIYDPSPYGYRLFTKAEGDSYTGSTSYSGSAFSSPGAYLCPINSICKPSYVFSIFNPESDFWFSECYNGISTVGYLARYYEMPSLRYGTVYISEITTQYGQKYHLYPVLSIKE